MEIKIIAVGKLKEKYLIEGIQEYTKRLKPYSKFQLVEVPDEKAPKTLSEKEMEQIKDKEGKKILSKIKDTDYVYALAIEGKQRSSEEFAKEFERLTVEGNSSFTFVIGGSLGLSKEVLKRGNSLLSYGKITYPHQLMRLVLTEQIYRTFKIIKNEPYHK